MPGCWASPFSGPARQGRTTAVPPGGARDPRSGMGVTRGTGRSHRQRALPCRVAAACWMSACSAAGAAGAARRPGCAQGARGGGVQFGKRADSIFEPSECLAAAVCCCVQHVKWPPCRTPGPAASGGWAGRHRPGMGGWRGGGGERSAKPLYRLLLRGVSNRGCERAVVCMQPLVNGMVNYMADL